MGTTFRQDLWPNRSAAENAFRKNKLFASFHPMVLENYLKYGLRELPTKIYPDLPVSLTDGILRPVTLTATKHREVWSYARSNFSTQDTVYDGHLSAKEQLINPSADSSIEAQMLFGRPEWSVTFDNLPHLRPATYFIFGGQSPFSPPKARTEKESRTGTGVDGSSGGIENAKVKSHIFENYGHFLPFANVKEVAEIVSAWISEVLYNVKEEDIFWKNYDS
ncbi:MAG: hypothetical protein Q9225_006053 [Loekoesia sp. 1 TL-2023]